MKGIPMQPVRDSARRRTRQDFHAYNCTCYLQTVTHSDVCIYSFTKVARTKIMVHAGSKIAVRALGANKTSEAQLEYRFQAKQWYHIVLTHSTGSALAPAWVRLFVNGTLEASERFKYPKVCILTTLIGRMSCCSMTEPHDCIVHATLCCEEVQ